MAKKREVEFTKRPFVENAEPRLLESIKFSLLSAAEIRNASVVHVEQALYYDNSRKPIANGLLDPKMGPANSRSAGGCATCHAKHEDCRGHFGCLELELPVFNIGYYGAILDILKCICKSCSRVLLEEKERVVLLKKMRNAKDSWNKNVLKKKIINICEIKGSGRPQKKCPRCHNHNGKLRKEKSLLTIIHDVPSGSGSKEPSLLDPVQVLSLFKRMADEDCELLYLDIRPEKLLLENIPVPPMSVRPSVFADGGRMSNEDDITQRLKQIIQTNARLNGVLQQPFSKYDRPVWECLQNEVALYINSEARITPEFQQGGNSKPLNGFVQRLKGKSGRFRCHLSGKRVQYTGRTVISPDPNLKITEVGIPIHMAVILTYPERVTSHNIEKLKQCVINGPDKYPGARYKTSSNGDLSDLKYGKRKLIAEQLKFGEIVHRHLVDGDVVLFNRQPSLHRMSIMCHRARVVQWRTLRFNESVCNPYNADFDGDEMNMHLPQTEEARTEALMLMGVQDNLCTPKSGAVLVASTQDFLTCSFLITRKDTFYDRAAFSLMCTYMGDAMDHIDLPTPAVVKCLQYLQLPDLTFTQAHKLATARPLELWTGKQLFNVLVRPHAQMRVYVNLMLREKNYMEPKERKTNCQHESMCPNDGFVYFRNSELLCGQLGKATLGNGGKTGLYSVLLRDYNPHAAATCMNRLAKLSARWIGNHGFSIGIDDVQPDKLFNDKKLDEISKTENECKGLFEKYSAGKLELMPGCDAAQTLEVQLSKAWNSIRNKTAKICMENLHWGNSPLIMSQCGSKGSPDNISQMVLCVGQQVVGGRRAPDSFIDRSLPHFPVKSKIAAAKGFVENSFYTGLEATEFFFHTMGGREGLVDSAVKTAETGYLSRRLVKFSEDLAVYYDNTVRDSSGTIIQFLYGEDNMDPAQMEGEDGFPLDFWRLLVKAQAICPDGKNPSLSLAEVKEITERRLSQHDVETSLGDKRPHALNKVSEYVEDAVAKKHWCVTKRQLEVFLDACISRLRSKRMEPGTAVGAIGAQSISEPGTQMTLKSFHFAGVAGMNVTLGVPRILEIVGASKKIKTPIIKAQLEQDDNEESAQSIKCHIEKTTLEQVAKSIKLEMNAARAYIEIELDLEKTKDLNINAYTVREKIVQSLHNKRKDLKQLFVKVHDESKLHVTADNDAQVYHFAIFWLKKKLPMAVVKGLSTVKRVIIAPKDEKKKDKKLQLIVEGTGLLEVMGMEGINSCATVSNHVDENFKVLGIEVTRTCIIVEINEVMKGYKIDVRHMMLLADLMTFKGQILPVSRIGLEKMKDSILALASFEKTADHLFKAPVYGKVEKIKGVSECIIMGVPMRLGTGMLDVMMERSKPGPALNYRSDPIIC